MFTLEMVALSELMLTVATSISPFPKMVKRVEEDRDR